MNCRFAVTLYFKFKGSDAVEEFTNHLDTLKKWYGTEADTDTILECMRRAVQAGKPQENGGPVAA
jgi:hypothetical protein